MNELCVCHVVECIFHTPHTVQDVQVQHGEGLHGDAGGSTFHALGFYAGLDAATEDGGQQASACKHHILTTCK
jgi:hypothetical protein